MPAGQSKDGRAASPGAQRQEHVGFADLCRPLTEMFSLEARLARQLAAPAAPPKLKQTGPARNKAPVEQAATKSTSDDGAVARAQSTSQEIEKAPGNPGDANASGAPVPPALSLELLQMPGPGGYRRNPRPSARAESTLSHRTPRSGRGRTPRTARGLQEMGGTHAPLPSSRVGFDSSTFALAAASGVLNLGEQKDELDHGITPVVTAVRDGNMIGANHGEWDRPVKLHSESLSQAFGIDWAMYQANLEAEANSPATASGARTVAQRLGLTKAAGSPQAARPPSPKASLRRLSGAMAKVNASASGAATTRRESPAFSRRQPAAGSTPSSATTKTPAAAEETSGAAGGTPRGSGGTPRQSKKSTDGVDARALQKALAPVAAAKREQQRPEPPNPTLARKSGTSTPAGAVNKAEAPAPATPTNGDSQTPARAQTSTGSQPLPQAGWGDSIHQRMHINYGAVVQARSGGARTLHDLQSGGLRMASPGQTRSVTSNATRGATPPMRPAQQRRGNAPVASPIASSVEIT